MRIGVHLTALAVLSFCVPTAFGQDRAEIARQAKAATALVEAGKRQGSAFCLHESGLFLTNEHVVRGATEVQMVLHPGAKKQQIVKARVLRTDKTLDLALLRLAEKI